MYSCELRYNTDIFLQAGKLTELVTSAGNKTNQSCSFILSICVFIGRSQDNLKPAGKFCNLFQWNFIDVIYIPSNTSVVCRYKLDG